MKPTNPVYTGLPTTIFEVMSRLAIEHKSINLGQGFPDVDGPEDVRRFAADALMAGPNQYPPMMGVPELRQAVAEANRRFYGLDVDWKSEVLVTSGATEALSDIITAVIEPGDEVVLIEPLYDCYLPLVRRAGGIPRLVRITPPEWRLDLAALEAAFSPRTKAILINNPMNPAAKVFTREELEAIAALCVRFDAYAICDEVYEHILFDGRAHIPLMTLPGMRERAIRIGSAGKTFSLTGWKVGYVTAAPALLDPIAKAHQFTTFTTPPNLQKAVAFGLGKDDAYYGELGSSLAAKRDRLAEGLARLGFGVVPCGGTYFVTADVTPLGLSGDDAELCRRMTVEAGVTAVPVSAFYAGEAPRNFVRFCFSKRDEILDGAVERLGNWLSERTRAVA
ncbi:aminotransferase [Kaistia geumhonensis]|uniref:Aspartate/methionine/tyrosine aminotransferase n=1 Tax=Kaistia geumhonensis TaxID=410839 RepID=A0ABU0M3S6_9HYPH|nr:aminotransferase [Kaistia geumhonensis]MCX5479159.1 aminotransferase [Kaistia geumhonensis]MDQ0515621.1 aspartate/methionine/tyrosine aminotransferase [Kaistia geumhonensis]